MRFYLGECKAKPWPGKTGKSQEARTLCYLCREGESGAPVQSVLSHTKAAWGFPSRACTCSHPKHAQFKVTIDKEKTVDTFWGAGFSSKSQSMCEREGLECLGHAQLEP